MCSPIPLLNRELDQTFKAVILVFWMTHLGVDQPPIPQLARPDSDNPSCMSVPLQQVEWIQAGACGRTEARCCRAAAVTHGVLIGQFTGWCWSEEGVASAELPPADPNAEPMFRGVAPRFLPSTCNRGSLADPGAPMSKTSLLCAAAISSTNRSSLSITCSSPCARARRARQRRSASCTYGMSGPFTRRPSLSLRHRIDPRSIAA